MGFGAAQRMAAATAGALLALALVGCGSESTEERVFTFYALGPSNTLHSPDRAIAVNSVLELSVIGADGEVDIAEASIAPDGVFEILRTENPVAVRPTASGTAVLHVVSSDGREDSVTLRARDPDSVVVSASLDFGPFSQWIDARLPDEQTSAGIVLLPQTTILLRASLYDADHERLLGYYGGAGWTPSSSDVVKMAFAFKRQEAVRVQPIEGATGKVTIAVAGEAVIDIEVAETAAADRLVVISGDNVPVSSVDLEVGVDDRAILYVFPVEATGRALFGNGSLGANAEITGTQGVAEISSLDPQTVLLETVAAGNTVARIEQLGAVSELPVRVRAPGAK